MTIQEAIKSGKPFKRPQDACYVQYFEKDGPEDKPYDYFLVTHSNGKEVLTSIDLYASEILADDWEIYEKKLYVGFNRK